jgi:enoyl-CoA hydratase/carnithine racemase
MEYQNFDCEIAEGCATVRMIGPGAPDMGNLCDEFVDMMLRLQEDRAVRMILFTDGDHAFDLHHNLDGLSEVHPQNQGFEMLAVEEEISRRIVTMIGEFSKPVVAATRGDIRNLGLGFYMAADIRLASDKASFTTQDMSGGLLPGWGLMHVLPRLIGPGRTLDFLWSHRTVGADEAWRMGLVDRLIDDQAWEEELDRFTDRMRRLPQPAVQLTKLGVQQAANLDLTSMLSVEWESQQQCWESLETAEGLRARQEGRPPILESSTTEEDE